MDYTKGQQFRLKQHVGHYEHVGGVATHPQHEDPTYEAFLDRHHPLFESQVGTVEASLEHEGEVWVTLQFDYHDPSTAAVDPVHPRRNVSFSETQMTEWFEAVQTIPSLLTDVVS